MESSKTTHGVDNLDTLTRMANLASTYRGQGLLDEAERLEARVMEIKQIDRGVDHPSTLTSMANLALTYMDQGRWTYAEELQTLVMKASMSMFGALRGSRAQ
ncbi:hypothetical protein B0T11DRAFT_244717 [Plectosphaerella cucumerina]|uniref:Kinesin light chain n=1 Tax=Plectosphaerella cucumerina TaxID=40658 RepID=A0A8K0TDB1_9PEZI|nr:hypothetical protein B0T11DRAFT_244717 [Plectosphaerella cucumerina]